MDAVRGYVYENWIGCGGIAFTRSTDDGRTFQAPTSVPSSNGPDTHVWDPAVAVAPDGTVYVTWDYGPERTSVKMNCAAGASCAFATGDFNGVIQKSTDKGKTWSQQSHTTPGFPASGADSAPSSSPTARSM